jgi:hypothetical protein
MSERTFQEVSDALAKAIIEIKSKKEVFDKASSAVNVASADYNTAISNAQYLRDELTKVMNDSMGAAQTNVRQSV